MARLALTLAVILGVVQWSVAGLVIVQEADQMGATAGKTTMTMRISGERARVDVGEQLSSIVDRKAGTVTSLMHPQKIAMQLPKGTLETVKEMATKSADKPDLKPTGKKETISGFACEEYSGRFMGMDVTYWVTNDVPDQKNVLEEMGRLSGAGDPFKAALSGGGDFPGFPIRTTVKSPQLGTSTMTVRSIKNEDVPDSAFQVPADYKAMELPQTQPPAPAAR